MTSPFSLSRLSMQLLCWTYHSHIYISHSVPEIALKQECLEPLYMPPQKPICTQNIVIIYLSILPLTFSSSLVLSYFSALTLPYLHFWNQNASILIYDQLLWQRPRHLGHTISASSSGGQTLMDSKSFFLLLFIIVFSSFPGDHS